MRISIGSPNIRLNDAIRLAAEKRPIVVLGRISTRIDHVSITLTDENGMRGGVDKHCRVKITVRGLGTVTTDARHESLLASTDKALRRARRIILKRFKRRVARSRNRAVGYIDASSVVAVAN